MAYDFSKNSKELLEKKLVVAVDALRFYAGTKPENRFEGVTARQALAFLWDIDVSDIKNIGDKEKK